MEREQVRSGTHATAGRQVSTWAHAIIVGKASLLGGSLAILDPLSNREPGASITDLWNQSPMSQIMFGVFFPFSVTPIPPSVRVLRSFTFASALSRG
jgi:hypothetical protein